jgi:peptidoglycan/LPS O-acetylase OafA/YrhL
VLTHCLLPYSHILAGCLLALGLHHPAGYALFRRLRGPFGGITWIGLWVAAHLATRSFGRAEYGTAWSPVYVITVVLMLGAVATTDGPIQRVLRWQPLTGIGRLSYAMYLTHLLPMYAAYRIAGKLPWDAARPYATFLLTVAGSVVVALVLAVTVERPFIRLGRRLSDRLMRSGRLGESTMKQDAAPAPGELIEVRT